MEYPKNGYALIKGKKFGHFVTQVPVYLGRQHQLPQLTEGQFFAVSEKKNISRKHLKITFEKDGQADKPAWYLYCFGKNGITIDGEFFSPSQNRYKQDVMLDEKITPCCRKKIEDKTRIQAGDAIFYFLLPDEYLEN